MGSTIPSLSLRTPSRSPTSNDHTGYPGGKGVSPAKQNVLIPPNATVHTIPPTAHIAARIWIGLIFGLVTTMAAASPTTDPAGTSIAWEAPMGRDHPLTGRIWDVAADRFIDEKMLLDRLATVRFVLAGESHNNPDHHQLQLRILESLFANGRRPAVGFELFTTPDQAELDRYQASPDRNPTALVDGLSWGKRRHALYELYVPLVRFAGEAGLPLVAMDLSSEEVAGVKLQGLDALPEALIARFGLDQPLPGSRQQILVQDLVKSHCGLLFTQNLEGPLLVQRARDATMAERLVRSDTGDGALMLSGYGHARKDRGVPFLLSEYANQGAVVSVLFASVKPGLAKAQDYAAWFGGEKPPFDYLWFTARVDDEDPCERLERLYRIPKQPPEDQPAGDSLPPAADGPSAAGPSVTPPIAWSKTAVHENRSQILLEVTIDDPVQIPPCDLLAVDESQVKRLGNTFEGRQHHGIEMTA